MTIIQNVQVRRHEFSDVPGEVHYIVTVSPIPTTAKTEDIDFQIASKIKSALDGLELDE